MLQGSSRPGPGCFSLLAASVAAALLTSASLATADELSAIMGCGQGGATCGSAVQTSGNVSTIQQNGSSNAASVEQRAILGGYANISSIKQNGDNDSASVTQSGSNNSVSITQHGDNDNATVKQNGSNLTAQVIQWGNASVGITQSGGSSTATGKH